MHDIMALAKLHIEPRNGFALRGMEIEADDILIKMEFV